MVESDKCTPWHSLKALCNCSRVHSSFFKSLGFYLVAHFGRPECKNVQYWSLVSHWMVPCDAFETQYHYTQANELKKEQVLQDQRTGHQI